MDEDKSHEERIQELEKTARYTNAIILLIICLLIFYLGD